MCHLANATIFFFIFPSVELWMQMCNATNSDSWLYLSM